MNLQEFIDKLNLSILTEAGDFSQITPTSGYTSDLLSCVMAGAKKNSVWVTLQAHVNIVAVAALLEVAAVIISENALPDSATISRANTEGIVLLSSPLPSFALCGLLWDLGLRSE